MQLGASAQAVDQRGHRRAVATARLQPGAHWTRIDTMKIGHRARQRDRKACEQARQTLDRTHAVQTREQRGAVGAVHDHERSTQPAIGSTREMHHWGREALTGDLGLDDGLLLGQRRVRHHPGHQITGQPFGRADEPKRQQLSPEPAHQSFGRRRVLERRSVGGGAKHGQQVRGEKVHSYGIYRNGCCR